MDKIDDFAGFVIFIILLIVFESFVKIEASSLWRISAFFHILHSGGEQTLLFEFVKPAHIAIELSMQLFGFGKTTLDWFLSAFVNLLPDIEMCEFVCLILEILPDVSSQTLGFLFHYQTIFYSQAACAPVFFYFCMPYIRFDH